MNGFRRSFVVLSIAATAAFVFLLSLGFWQLQRLEWKEGLLAQIAARAEVEPVSLQKAVQLFENGEDIRFLRVTLNGEFDHGHERHLYDILEGKAVWRIITPLRQDGMWVLVDRGGVPEAYKQAVDRPDTTLENSTVFAAQVRHDGMQGWFVPDNDVETNQWFWRDQAAMGEGIDGALAPFLVEALGPTGSDAQLVPAPLQASSLSNRHMEYALTWFGLAATLLAVYLGMVWTRMRA